MKFTISILLISVASFFFYNNKEQPNIDALDVTLSDLSSTEKSKTELIQNIMDAYVTDNDVPALAVGLVEKGEVKSILSKGFLKRKQPQKVDENSIFQIASLSKTFTGIIASSMEAEGIINLEDKASTFFPKNTSPAILEKLQSISVKDILLHQAGLPRDAKNLKRKMFGGPVIGTYTEANLFDDLEKMQVEFEPGAKWSYSNVGYSCVGYILEQASGMSYDDLLKKYVADKFGLKNTAIHLNEKQQQEQLATAYLPEWNTKSVQVSNFGKQNPASGIYSTVEDLSRLMVIQMEAYKNFETTDHPLLLTKEKRPLGEAGRSPNYGYGFFEFRKGSDPNTQYLGHGGDFDGFASCYFFFPKADVGLVMLTSSGGRWFLDMEQRIHDVMVMDIL